MAHFILDNAKRYEEPILDIVPENATYNTGVGYWMDSLGLAPLISSGEFQNLATKKEDRETGEDQKGE